MRILIVTTFFPPLNSIASLRPHSWAKYWTLAGHEVTVLTTGKNEDPATSLKMAQDEYETIEVAMPAFFSRLKKNVGDAGTGPRSWLGKIFDYLRYQKGLFNAARMPDFTDLWAVKAYRAIRHKGPWDLVVSTSGPYCVHLIAHQLKKSGAASQWIADYRDTWSDNYIYPGLFPFNRIEKWLERRILRRCDAVTIISEPFADSFRKTFDCRLVETIENGFDPLDLTRIGEAACFPVDGKFRIVHTGSIYLGKRDPTPLFQAIQEIKGDSGKAHLLDRLEVLFVGPRQANLESLIAQYNVGKWVKMHGFVSREEALRMQRDAHALLFLAWNDLSVDGVLTGKIFEYLYAKTPILAVGAAELEASQRLILEAKAGYAFGSVEAIKSYLVERLIEGKKEALPYDEQVINRYNRKALAEKMLKLASPHTGL